MHIKSLQLKNVGPFQNFEVKPKILTIIRGRNGSGKTTIVNAVRYLGEKNHDPSFIKDYGKPEVSEFAEIRLVIADPGHEYDGANFVCTITADRTTRVLHHPKLGKIPVAKSKEWIESVVNMISLDPIRFLTATDKEQIAIFLQAQPIKVTADQLGFLPAGMLKGIDLDKHALEVLGDKDSGIYGALYEERGTINAEAKTKAAYASQLTTTLPGDAPEGDWGDVLQSTNEAYRQLQKTTAATIAAIDREANETKKIAHDESSNRQRTIRDELDAAIEALRVAAQIESDIVAEQEVETKNGAEARRLEQRAVAEQDYRPKEAELKEKIGQAKAMVEQCAKSQTTRDLISQAQTEASGAEVQSANLTKAMKQIETLKAEMLKETPIPGLEISGGSLVLDGVVLKRVNDAKKHLRVALSIARLQAGPLGFIVMDNAEKFDEEQYPIVKKVAAELGMQVMMFIATARDKEGNKIEGPLAIETEGVA